MDVYVSSQAVAISRVRPVIPVYELRRESREWVNRRSIVGGEYSVTRRADDARQVPTAVPAAARARGSR